MDNLPSEVFDKIILQSDINDILLVCNSNKEIYNYCKSNENYLSRKLFKIHLPNILLPNTKQITLRSFEIIFNGIQNEDNFIFDKADKITVDIFLLNDFQNDNYGQGVYDYCWIISDQKNNKLLVKYYLYKYFQKISTNPKINFNDYSFWILSCLLSYKYDEDFIISIYNKLPQFDKLEPIAVNDEYYETIDEDDPLILSIEKEYYNLSLLIISKYNYNNIHYQVSNRIEVFIENFQEIEELTNIQTTLVNKLIELITILRLP